MPTPAQLAHRNVTSTALPYKSFISPTDTTPALVTGSKDILTSISSYAERRPGFSLNLEPTPTTFNNLQRLFSWDRFDGTFIELACDVNSSNQAVVYKRIIGVDNSFVAIWTDTTSSKLYDFGVSNNTVYFSNGNFAKAWEPVNGIRNWGISIGAGASPTTDNAGNGADAGGGGQVWTNPNNVTGDTAYATAAFPLPLGTTQNYLNCTQFGFSIGATATVFGISVAFRDGTVATNGIWTVSLLSGGNQIGTPKTVATGSGIITLGTASDLWGASWTGTNINATTFGVAFTCNGGTPAFTASIRDVSITVYAQVAPVATPSGSAGAMTASIGWQYVFCYGNSNSAHVSSPTPVSASTGPRGGIISTTTLGSGGTGYAANDTGIINAGNANATYTVNTVSAGGAVLTYTINSGGTGYILSSNVATARTGTQAGSGGLFTINITAVTGILNISVALVASTDPQVNQIRLYRSTDSVPVGAIGGTFFELPNSPFPNTTQSVLDTAADTALNIFSIAPFPGFNDPPTPGQQATYFAGRFWLFKNNQVFFSGLEEIITGVFEESFPSGKQGNFWNFDQPVQGLAVAGTGLSQTLAILCGGRIYGIVGNSLDTFRRFLVSNRRGCRNLNTVTSLGGAVAWYDSSSTVWMTDGQSLQEISLDVRSDFINLSPIGATFTFHVSGKYHWLVCAFPKTMLIYDLDLGQWMPPWSIGSSTVFSGETSPGVYDLMLSNGSKALKLNPAGTVGSFNDNSVTYQPIMKFSNLSIVPDFGRRFSYASLGLYDEPSRTGQSWYVQADTNSTSTFDDSLILIDDDPLNSTSVYSSIARFTVDTTKAWLRSNGKNLIQNVWSTGNKVGRWISIQFVFKDADQVDRIFSYFLAYTQKR